MQTTVAQTEQAAIEETARLFVRNLPYAATEADLAAAFEAHGELSEVHLVLDRRALAELALARQSAAPPTLFIGPSAALPCLHRGLATASAHPGNVHAGCSG